MRQVRAMFSFLRFLGSVRRSQGPAQGPHVFLSDSAMTSTCMWIAAPTLRKVCEAVLPSAATGKCAIGRPSFRESGSLPSRRFLTPR